MRFQVQWRCRMWNHAKGTRWAGGGDTSMVMDGQGNVAAPFISLQQLRLHPLHPCEAWTGQRQQQ